jgi:ATP phosphoribosyltransferase
MLKLGVPSKGRLQQDTFDWFAQFGLELTRTGSDREYAAALHGIDGVELVLLSAGEIPRELAAGNIHMGVTGTDLVHEKLPLRETQVASIDEMGFGHADLILAIPNSWIDVTRLSDLDSVAAQFRADHGFRLRIATKYHNLVREYLSQAGIADYQLIDSQGATEGTIKNLRAEAIADITSSGATLAANHLKIIPNAVILKSQATLFASKTADWSSAKAVLDRLLETCKLDKVDL